MSEGKAKIGAQQKGRRKKEEGRTTRLAFAAANNQKGHAL